MKKEIPTPEQVTFMGRPLNSLGNDELRRAVCLALYERDHAIATAKQEFDFMRGIIRSRA